MKKVYMIGNAHIDPVWLWRKTEGLSEILATFRSALDRMDEFPGFIFTAACASYYQWVEAVDPELFARIQRRVAEGRWVLAGGFWVQPDCNLPSGEAFARHALYSQRYFKEKFGVTAKIGYNVDSFGHNGMLPQLLVKAGMSGYIFMRPDEDENGTVPGDLFVWQSPDGSRVMTARIPLQYGDVSLSDLHDDRFTGMHPAAAKALLLRERAERTGVPCFCFYGVGNHGGGPTIASLRVLEPLAAENSGIVFSSVEQLFNDVMNAPLAQALPTVTGDLQHHASGCYSANSAVKAANRRAENELAAAEKMDVLAHRLTGSALHTCELRDAWEALLFNQFHDVLAGCCIKEAYTDALNEMAAARNAAANVLRLASQRISWRVRTTRVLDGTPAVKNGWLLWEKEGEGAPVVVFNPHSFAVRTAVQVNVEVSCVADSAGLPVACQKVRGPQTNLSDLYNTMFTADIPALGYSTYYLYKDVKFSPPQTPMLRAGEDFLENEFLRVRFDMDTGRIVSFYDKQARKELAAAPMAGAVVIDDTASDTWAHRIFTFDNEIGSFGEAQVTLLEAGPLRAALRVRTEYRTSNLEQIFYLSAGAHELEVRCSLDLHERHRIVKLTFPVDASKPEATYSMPYGFLKKPCDGVEEPGHNWVGITSQSSGDGLALLNDSKYSFCAKGNELRMIVARSAIYADHFGQRDDRVEHLDQGEQKFIYALRPCRQSDLADVVLSAALLNQPPHIVLETHHDGELGSVWSGITISAPNVICQALKRSEDGIGMIARLYETAGKQTHARVQIGSLDADMELEFIPQEIKTLRIADDGSWREVLLTEYDG